MNPQRDTLSEALREMAAASPAASPELGARLSIAFARHHVQQRRRKRAGVVLGLAVCLAISIYWLRPHRAPETVKVTTPAPQTAQAPVQAPKMVAAEDNVQAQFVASTGAKSKARANRTRNISEAQLKEPRTPDAEEPLATIEAGDFIALPTFDPTIPVGQSRIVRMNLPGSDLQLIGYPVDGQLLDRRIVTDVLVGQDGMPYAVRLVNTRNVR
jgi:hypothetical protein